MKKISIATILLLTIALSSAQFGYPPKKPTDEVLEVRVEGVWEYKYKDEYSRRVTFTKEGVFLSVATKKDGSVFKRKGVYSIERGSLIIRYPKQTDSPPAIYSTKFPRFKVEGDKLWLPPAISFGAINVYRRIK